MKHLFGLLLLALVAVAPGSADAANCFWVGGTGTWDASSITHWAPTTGASATGCSTTNAAPATGDSVTFDGSSGGGTVSVSSAITGLSLANITAGAFTGTLDFSVGNPNITISNNMSVSGTATRSINLGSGTWTFLNSGGTPFTIGTTTNLTATFQNASFVYTANTSSNRTLDAAGQTLGPVTISTNSTRGLFIFNGSGTYASLTVGAGNIVSVTQLTSVTITGALTMTGTSSSSVALVSTTQSNNATVSVGSASTIDYGTIYRITKSGAGSITATNSFDMTGNSGVTITGPSGGGGGGGGGRIIGG